VPLDALAQMCECSLVRAIEQGEMIRFGMLETLREYAQRQLTESAEVRTRHRDHFMAFADTANEKLIGLEQARCAAVLEAEHDNLRRRWPSAWKRRTESRPDCVWEERYSSSGMCGDI